MDVSTALISFSIAATVLTMTPGLDTALVLNTAAVRSGGAAMHAGAGVVTGVLVWGVAAAFGIGALLVVSKTAYAVLKFAGAAYLLWLGGAMLLAAFRKAPVGGGDHEAVAGGSTRGWFLRGLFTNLLNPKVGVFYISLLPQFIPAGANAALFGAMLAAIHAAMGLVWFGVIVLATRPVARWLKHPDVVRALNGMTGAVLIGFGLRLFFEKRPA